MHKPRKNRGRGALIALAVLAVLAGSLTVYGYAARRDPGRMAENRIVHLERLTYIDLPETRFIGMAIDETEWPAAIEACDALWERRAEFMPVLDAMAEYATVITGTCVLSHNNDIDHSDPESAERCLIGRFMRAGAPVPDGFDCYDIPAAKVALGICRGEFSTMTEKGPGKLYDKVDRGRYSVPYPQGWFFAEVYLPETVPEDGAVTRMGFLVPCQ